MILHILQKYCKFFPALLFPLPSVSIYSNTNIQFYVSFIYALFIVVTAVLRLSQQHNSSMGFINSKLQIELQSNISGMLVMQFFNLLHILLVWNVVIN